jgi:hypothetical protein
MMASARTPETILICVEGASFDWEGQQVTIVGGRTTVRAGHPMLAGREHLFRELTPDYDHTTTSAPASSVRADQRGATSR